jgi:hypothetical protein
MKTYFYFYKIQYPKLVRQVTGSTRHMKTKLQDVLIASSEDSIKECRIMTIG